MSIAGSSASNGSKSSQDLGPMHLRRKMVVGGFEDNTERDEVVTAVKDWIQKCSKSDLVDEVFAFPAGKISYVAWHTPRAMYDFIENYRTCPKENRFAFEGRELWCNVHKSKEERKHGTPLTKALELMVLFVAHVTNSNGPPPKIIPNLSLQQLIWKRQVIATVKDDQLMIEAEPFSGLDQNVVQTQMVETAAAFTIHLRQWREQVQAKELASTNTA